MVNLSYTQSDMKELNIKGVFDLITSRETISRVEISKTLGISIPTVLKITNILLQKNLIRMVGEKKTSRGRYPQLYRFDPDVILGIGVDYNGVTAQWAVCNYCGKTLASASQQVDTNLDHFLLDELPGLLNDLLDKNHIPREKILGIGLCVPGLVDTDTGTLQISPLSQIVVSAPLNKLLHHLTQQTGFPVYCFNDVNAAAIGEFVLRGLKNEDLVYFQVGDGSGAGIILNGRLRTGVHFAAGEIGNLTFDPSFVLDIRKPGWFEMKLSNTTLCQLFPSYAKGEMTPDLIDYVAQYVALAISNTANLLDFQYIILNGTLVRLLGEPLMLRIQYYVDRFCIHQVLIQKASCENPGLAGTTALMIAREIGSVLTAPVE